MRQAVSVIALAAVLAACGSSDGPSASPNTASQSPTIATSAPPLALREACSVAEGLMPAAAVPSAQRAKTAAERLGSLSSRSDEETQIALKPLIAAFYHLVFAEQGADSLAAFDEETEALRRMSTRCGAVGSSAFQ